MNLNLITLAGFFALAGAAVGQSASQKPAAAATAAERPDAGNLRAFVELARSDLKNQKALIIAENLPLSEAEAAEFWPVQRDYEDELSKVNDQKLALLVRYANSIETMTDKEAEALARESFSIEAQKTELKRKYFKKLLHVIPATKAARFFQVENQLNLALDLKIAASLPLIK